MGNEQTAIHPVKAGYQVFHLLSLCTKADSKRIMIPPPLIQSSFWPKMSSVITCVRLDHKTVMREQFTGKQQELLQKPKAYNTFLLVPQSRSNESSSLMLKKVILLNSRSN